MILVAFGSWLIGMIMGLLGSEPAPTTSPSVTVTETVTETVEAEPAEDQTTEAPKPEPTKEAAPKISDGTYLVGSEIKRGTWKSSGEEGGLCYADTQTKGGTILSQEVSNGEPVVIRIGSSAYTFKSSGCGTWRKVG